MSRITRHLFIRFTVGCAVLVIAFGAASAIRADEPKGADRADPKDSRDQEIAALRRQNREQQKEIARLQGRIDSLQRELERATKGQTPPRLVIPSPARPSPVPRPPTPPDTMPNPLRGGVPDGQIPPNWIPRQFNGQTYYLIPLQDNQAVGGKGGPVMVAPADPTTPAPKQP